MRLGIRTSAASLALALISVFAAGCGGGGGSGAPPLTPIQPALLAPEGVTLAPGTMEGQAVLTWAAVAGATGYDVYLSSSPGVTPENYATLPGGMHVTTDGAGPLPIGGLMPGVTYYVVVSARDARGAGPLSGEASIVLPPGAPLTPRLTVGSSGMRVEWSEVQGATSYEVAIARDAALWGGNWSALDGGQMVPARTSPTLFRNLFGVDATWVVVRALNAAGGGPWSVPTPASTARRLSFVTGDTLDAGGTPSAVLAVRLDPDSVTDLVIVDSDADQVVVRLGVDTGGFAPARIFSTGSRPVAAAVADLDGDGVLDLVTANADDGSVSVLAGDGFGGFEPKVDFPACSSPSAIAVGSLDASRDSHVDIAVADGAGASVAVLFGNGDGTFDAPANFEVAPAPISLVVADADADGRLDLLAANETEGMLSVLLSDGTGTFPTRRDSPLVPGVTAVVAGPFLAAAPSSLIVTSAALGHTFLAPGLPDGTFAPADLAVTGSSPQALASADFDGDGIRDVAVVDPMDGTTSVVLSDGHGFLWNLGAFATGSGPAAISTGDFDGDGTPDLAVADAAAGTVTLYLTRWD